MLTLKFKGVHVDNLLMELGYGSRYTMYFSINVLNCFNFVHKKYIRNVKTNLINEQADDMNFLF